MKPSQSCIAGFIFAILTAILFYYLSWIPEEYSLTEVLIFGGIVGIFGQAGDFIESVFKRDAQIKDSGKLLLGHGGVLDRFDAFFMISPIAYLFFMIIG